MTVEEWLGKDNIIGIDIWHKKYQYRNETFEEWLDRVSGKNEYIRNLIKEKKFLFGGRILSNRGTETSGSLCNCYSEGYCPDDYAGIMDAAKDLGLTFKAQGGQGISLSLLRPKGAPIGNDYVSDGIVPFMKIFNEVTDSTSQGGARKGALMISLDANHKEAETFITIKSELGLIEKANLSLEVNDDFMEAVEEFYNSGKVITLHEHKLYGSHWIDYDVIPINIFKAMVHNCYDWADPACLFVNEFRNHNLMELDDDYNVETSNACSEQPLPKFGACNLSSFNLSEFVINPYTPYAEFDYSTFELAISFVVDAMNIIIDENIEKHPLDKQKEVAINYRNVGIGVFGYANMLMKLGMTYGSNDALRFTDNLFSKLFELSVLASINIAKKYGSFPKYKDCVFDSRIIKEHFSKNEIDEFKSIGIRNCSLISIAPTGSISTMLGESGGCEPEFAIKYKRKTVSLNNNEDKYYDIYCKSAREYQSLYNTSILPNYFVSSQDVAWKDRVLTQAIMQKHVDTAISSTVNLPNSISEEEIAQLYLFAWKNKLKGITIYRSGCKKEGILTTPSTETENESLMFEELDIPRGYITDVPEALTYRKYKIQSGCGALYLFVGIDESEGKIYDVFTNTNGAGGCTINTQANSRLMSACIRGGIPVEYIVEQLQKSGTCPSYQYARGSGKKVSPGKSCPSAIGKILQDILTEFEQYDIDDRNDIQINDDVEIIEATECPECKNKTLYHEGGCIICKSCGYSKCS